MTSTDLASWIATEIMGWHLNISLSAPGWWLDSENMIQMHPDAWNPIEDANHHASAVAALTPDQQAEITWAAVESMWLRTVAQEFIQLHLTTEGRTDFWTAARKINDDEKPQAVQYKKNPSDSS